jgi:hypothetical protein
LHLHLPRVAVKPHLIVGKIRPIGGVRGYKAATDPQILLELVLPRVVIKFAVGLYVVYDLQRDDVGFADGFLGDYSKVFLLREQ